MLIVLNFKFKFSSLWTSNIIFIYSALWLMFLSLRSFKYFSHVSQFKERRLHNGFRCFPIPRKWANFPTSFSSVLFHNLSYSDAFVSLNRSSIQLRAAPKRHRCLLILKNIPSLNCLMMLIGLEEYVSIMCSHFFQFRRSRVTSVVDLFFLVFTDVRVKVDLKPLFQLLTIVFRYFVDATEQKY